VRHTPNDIALR